MKPFRFGLRGVSRRRFVSVSVVGLLTACTLVLGVATALGQLILSPTPNPLPGSNFQGGDGNQADEGGHLDWQGLRAASQVGHKMDATGNQDDSFTSGSKELAPGDWILTRTSVTPKDNILDTYRAFEHQTGHDAFLYLAFTREHGNGTTFLTFELNQRAGTWRNPRGFDIPCRQTGDLLIGFTQHGSDTSVQVYEWVTMPTNDVDPTTGCAKAGILQPVNGLTSDDVQAAFNPASITNYLPGHTPNPIPVKEFGEVAINLTTVITDMEGEGELCSSGNFASVWAHSRASDEETSAMKDYVAPEPFVVRTCKAQPTLSTQQHADIAGIATPTASVPLGTSIFDTANLHGAVQPTGTITFRLYGPNDRRCSRRPIFPSTVDVTGGTASYNSPSFTPRRPGTYRWRVTYSGDANNEGAGPTGCQEEPVVVTKARPAITTEASGTTVLPGPIHDTATLIGGVRPRGSIKFEVFRPSDETCTSPIHVGTVPVARGADTYTSPNFTPTEAGTWRWIANYSGDRRNAGVSTHCNDSAEDVVVDSPTTPPTGKPRLTTTATSAAPAGSPIVDTAHLTGGSDPTGTITFYVYGPNNSECTGAPAAPPSTVTVSGAGDYHSTPFTPTGPGAYRWVAHYSGDTNNESANTSCNESGETSVVSKATPAISTSASPATAPYGSAIGDTAVLTGGADPRGTITFRLYGPNNATCITPPAFVVRQVVNGNGSYPSPTVVPTLAGTYRWVATYSGDGRNASAATRCGDPTETGVVQAPRPIPPTPDEPTPKPKPKPRPKPKPPVKPIVTG